jgi:dsDNA-specific endonuclease/ATPase MutS2
MCIETRPAYVWPSACATLTISRDRIAMPSTFSIGDSVQTPLGKGVVRDVRNRGRLLVEIDGRAAVFDASAVRLAELPKSRGRQKDGPVRQALSSSKRSREGGLAADVDLHGLTVEEALARAESAINDALLADVAELRVIHGRSGGRIRAALSRRLREIRAVRAFRIDPRNEGVTIVSF